MKTFAASACCYSAAARRRRCVNTLWRWCESSSPETLSNTRLNGPLPLTVPQKKPRLSKNPPRLRGALHLAGQGRGREGGRESEERRWGAESVLTHLSKRLMLGNNGGIM